MAKLKPKNENNQKVSRWQKFKIGAKKFFGKVGRGIKKAAGWVWNGFKWVVRNVLPTASRVTTAITGGTGAVGAAARAAGAIGEVIGGNAGNAIQQGANRVEHATQRVEQRTNEINNTVQNKGRRIGKIVNEAANNIRNNLRQRPS